MNPDRIRHLFARHLPDCPVESVLLLGQGLDNAVYEVNGTLLVRFNNNPGEVTREAALLTHIHNLSLVPIPKPLFADQDHGCLTYRKLPGVPVINVRTPPANPCGALAAALGTFLAALHAIPPATLGDLIKPDNPPLAEWLDEARQAYQSVAGHLPAPHRPLIEAFLATPPPPGASALVFSHNDLGLEHVLIDPATSTITGIIDWTDAALTDPATDFARLYRDLGPAALTIALTTYANTFPIPASTFRTSAAFPAPLPTRAALNPAHHVGATEPMRAALNPALHAQGATEPMRADGVRALRERAVFYARCLFLEDLAYGLQTGKTPYITKSLTALPWLFPTQSPSAPTS
jgi:aminoglycoside phosphotransferase (APT) family kinase protein